MPYLTLMNDLWSVYHVFYDLEKINHRLYQHHTVFICDIADIIWHTIYLYNSHETAWLIKKLDWLVSFSM